jgi:hypothetical protein
LNRPTSEQARVDVVSVVKDALLHNLLLSDWERSFVYEIATSYARFGDKTQTSNNKLVALSRIAAKLCLNVRFPALPEED